MAPAATKKSAPKTTKTTAAQKRAARPRQGARHGDATGQKREALAREQAAAIKEREGELTTISLEHQRSVDEDIVDMSDPSRPVLESTGRPVDEAQAEAEEREEETLISGYGAAPIYRIEEVDEEPNRRYLEALRTDKEYLEEMIVVRINADLENVTIGQGNHYDFEEGRRYRLPRWVAIHLEEKGLLWH